MYKLQPHLCWSTCDYCNVEKASQVSEKCPPESQLDQGGDRWQCRWSTWWRGCWRGAGGGGRWWPGQWREGKRPPTPRTTPHRPSASAGLIVNLKYCRLVSSWCHMQCNAMWLSVIEFASTSSSAGRRVDGMYTLHSLHFGRRKSTRRGGGERKCPFLPQVVTFF